MTGAGFMPANNANHFAVTRLVLLVGGLIGLTYVYARTLATGGAHPLWMVLAQTLGGGLGLWLVNRAGGSRLVLTPRRVRYYLISGLLGLTLPNALGYLALRDMPAGLLAMIVPLAPLFTWLFAGLAARRWQHPVRLVGLVFGLAGVLIALAPRSGSLSVAPRVLGPALAMPVLLATGNVYRARALPAGGGPVELAAGMLLSQAVLIMAALTCLPGIAWPDAATALRLAALALLTVAMYLPYFRLQRLADPVRFSQIGYVIPVAGLLGGALFLGEPLQPSVLASLPLLLLGLAVTGGHLRGRALLRHALPVTSVLWRIK
jgi:drug/metabolite transporter (DMT)-like permease